MIDPREILRVSIEHAEASRSGLIPEISASALRCSPVPRSALSGPHSALNLPACLNLTLAFRSSLSTLLRIRGVSFSR